MATRDTRDNYGNPRCAHARRGLIIIHGIMLLATEYYVLLKVTKRGFCVYSSFLSINNTVRIEAETPLQREGQLLRDSQAHRNQYEVNPLLPLFDQPAVKLKIRIPTFQSCNTFSNNTHPSFPLPELQVNLIQLSKSNFSV